VSAFYNVFDHNLADTGGVVGPNCWEGSTCAFIYQENVFSNNVAITKGGAYYYPKYRPKLINNTFTNNTAKYGPDIGSIPIKIFINDSISNEVILENIPSGQIVPFEMTISLKDWDN